MFRHLDDPAPPAPDGAQLRSVHRRAGQLRFERRRRWASTVVAVALCSALLATGLLSVRSSNPTVALKETAYQFNQSLYLHADTPVPTTTLTDVVFVYPSVGFALAAHRNELVLAATSDGGSSWHLVNGHLPDASLFNSAAPVQMEFTSPSDGYLWEGTNSEESTAPLLVTNDGGRTWTEAPIGPVVYDVSAIGTDVWAIVGCGPACGLVAEVSTDGGGTWRLGPSGPIPSSLANPGEPSGVELARVTVTRAYILSIIPGAAATLAFTADGGFSWSTRAVPCADPFDLGAEIALSSTNDLWLVCGGQASAGSQAKALYRSSTGGLTWSLVAQTAAFAGAPVPSPGAGLLPLEGYVAPYSIGHKNLNVLSANLAWLFPTRGNVITTTDGGASWNAVPGLEEESFGSGAPGNLTFISATTGWVAELGVGLWHTTDGTNWLALGT